MHIVFESGKIYLYDNQFYRQIPESSYGVFTDLQKVNDHILYFEQGQSYKKEIPFSLSDLPPERSIPTKEGCLHIINFFEKNFNRLYQLILEKSGSFKQTEIKIFSDGKNLTRGKQFAQVFAAQLIKTYFADRDWQVVPITETFPKEEFNKTYIKIIFSKVAIYCEVEGRYEVNH